MLSDKEILRAIKYKRIEIKPFTRKRLGPVSYDILTNIVGMQGNLYQLVSEEEFKLSRTIAGIISARSRVAKLGLFASFSLIIDPGYQGHLIFLVQDVQNKYAYDLPNLDNLFQVSFFRVKDLEVSYDERKTSTAMFRKGFK